VLFNSTTFVAFFGLVLALYYSPLPWRRKKAILLVASYLFYAAWNPPFVILIWVSTVVDWMAAKGLGRTSGIVKRRALLLVSLTANLGLLGFFKYGQFLLDNFVVAAAYVGIHYTPPGWNITLPVGISFYTFQTLSYTIDVYRGRIRPWHSFLDFALFVTFFPQLVAGPIVRAADFLPQLSQERRASPEEFGWGLTLFTIGIFQKVVLADAWMAPVVDLVYGSPQSAGFLDAWAGTLAFSAQIFFDFSGYSTCAIGIALTMGFALPDNFRAPYAARGFSDFWRRWHISLSSWLRDYLYIPLGGNRKGRRRTYINLMLTMLLGGLWHGASWRFVVWGGLHGTYLAVERWITERYRDRLPSGGFLTDLGVTGLTYGLVLITWVFFRAGTFGDAFLLIQALFGFRPDTLVTGLSSMVLVALVTVGLLVTHRVLRDTSLEDVWGRMGTFVRACLIALLLLATFLSPGEDRAFIYFQF
jgi:D-alanyl-lipoteichoic acid acyltransferase DltB (MBOAT superfamily)